MPKIIVILNQNHVVTSWMARCSCFVFFAPLDDEELENSGNGFKAAIPRSLIRRILFACRGHVMSGHGGITETNYRAKQLYHWKRMRRDVRNYVRSCPHCQQYKLCQKKVTAGEYTPHNISEPWETVAVDLMQNPLQNGMQSYIIKELVKNAKTKATEGKEQQKIRKN
uniref:Integrase zinc-binding domain-containing protein n=1 Tax=Strigamia maritima TaxID=126957 RepID=T1ILN1_STRMM